MDLPKLLVDGAQVIGSGLGLLALGSESESAEKEQIATLLMPLPPREDFPLTRAALQVWPRMEGTQELVRQIRHELRHRDRPAGEPVPHYWSPDLRWRFVARRRRSVDRSVIRDELNTAISARIVDPSTDRPMTFGREPVLPTLVREEPAPAEPDAGRPA